MANNVETVTQMENSELINTKTTFWVQNHGMTTLNPVLLLLLLMPGYSSSICIDSNVENIA